jgi:hypothetical protein
LKLLRLITLKGFLPVWGLGSEKMNPPNLHYVNCCSACSFAQETIGNLTIYCKKFKQYFDPNQVCDAFEE